MNFIRQQVSKLISLRKETKSASAPFTYMCTSMADSCRHHLMDFLLEPVPSELLSTEKCQSRLFMIEAQNVKNKTW